MKKYFLTLIIICMLMSVFCTGTFAEGFDFELSMLGATSTNVNVTVKNVSQSQADALLYVAAYDEYGAFLGVICKDISLDQGASEVISEAFVVNKAHKLKAFVWGGTCIPKSVLLYKTTASEDAIEYGGEI